MNKDAQKITILESSKEYTREDGTKAVSYNAKVVYGISQTSAASSRTPYRSFPPKGEKLAQSGAPPSPTKSNDFVGTLNGQQPQEPKNMRELVSALIDANPVPFQPVDSLEVPAYYDREQ